MSWQRRLRDIVIAGGAAAAAGCASTSATGTPCGNANPDPCICGRPEQSSYYKQLCDEQTDCKARGGVFDPTTCANCGPNGATVEPHCSVQDGGADGSAHD